MLREAGLCIWHTGRREVADAVMKAIFAALVIKKEGSIAPRLLGRFSRANCA